MLKKILTYSGLFVAVFLFGVLLAFGWSKLFSKKHVQPAPPQTESWHVSGTTATGAAALKDSSANSKSETTSTPPLSNEKRPAPTVHSPAVPSAPSTSPNAGAAPLPHTVPVEATHDIFLLIDSSGSMKRTDPGNYRTEAAKLFISLLDKDDRVGIISFGDSATVLMPLTQNRRQNRTELIHAVTRVTSRELTTDITEAVRKAFGALKTDQSRQGIIIMLSDGKIDLGSKEKDDASFAELNLLLSELARSNIKLYTVAFTEQSDSTLLERMAKETGGAFRFAREDRDVHTMFSSIFEKIKSPDILPFEGESFTIDREIRESTILATKKARTDLSLIDPSSRKHAASKHAPNMAWFESSVFDMITIHEPAAGTWSVKLSTSEGNKVYILTNLSLKTTFDRSFVERGDRVIIDAWLEKQGGMVSEKDILENTSFSAEFVYPDRSIKKIDLLSAATSTGAQPVQGKYTAALDIAAAGEYTLKLLAIGKTFRREKIITFRAVEPSAAVRAPEKKELLPAQPSLRENKDVSWIVILMQFFAVNALIIALVVLGLFIRKKVGTMRKTK